MYWVLVNSELDVTPCLLLHFGGGRKTIRTSTARRTESCCKERGRGKRGEGPEFTLLWWGQLVTSPLWAQELSFEHLLEIARTDRQTTSKLSTQRVSRFCLPIVAVPSQSYNLPFGIPLSLPHYAVGKVCTTECFWPGCGAKTRPSQAVYARPGAIGTLGAP